MEKITDKKRAIFESMLVLVRENGFHGCAMSALSKSAGVAAGTIYHHFESKEQLINELYEYTSARILKAMFAGDSQEKPYQERFLLFWDNLCGFYCANPDVLVFYEQYMHSPYNPKRFEEGHDHFHQQFFDFVGEGIRQGYFREVNKGILGVLVHSNIRTAARIQGVRKFKIGDEELGQIKQILWDGLSKG